MKLLYITAFEPTGDSTSLWSKTYAERITQRETTTEITIIAVSDLNKDRVVEYAKNMFINYGLTQKSSFSSITKNISRSIENTNPDIVHLFFNYVTFGSILKSLCVLNFISKVCDSKGIKHYLTLHSIIVDPFMRLLSDYRMLKSPRVQFKKVFSLISLVFLKYLKNSWDKIILPSVSEFDYFKRVLNEEERLKIQHIPLGFEFNEIKHLFTKANSDDRKGETRILFIGAIAPYKGVHNLIKAFANLNKKIANVNLSIIGRATQRGRSDLKYFNQLLHLAKSENIENVCSIRNEWLTQESIVSYLQTADLIVFPTLNDGTLSFLSSPYISLLTKKRIIMTNVPRMYDYKSIRGIIFSDPDPESLFATIYAQVVNPKIINVDYSDAYRIHEIGIIIEKYLHLYHGTFNQTVENTTIKMPLLKENIDE